MRNFANRLLLIAVLVVVCWGQTTFTQLPVSWSVVPTADTDLSTKTYLFDQINLNGPSATTESLYDALGVKAYNQYLADLPTVDTDGLDEVVIAIIDTGLDVEHPVFATGDRVLTDYAVDFSQGVPEKFIMKNDLTDESNLWYQDQNGHGTHVAGLVADMTLDNVKILPIRIFAGVDNKGGSSDYAFENAVRYIWALQNQKSVNFIDNNGKFYPPYTPPQALKKHPLNIIVVNMSLGTTGFDVNNSVHMADFDRAKYGYTENGVTYTGFQNAIDLLLQSDILPIVAAGNVNKSGGESAKKTYYSLPGACDGVLAVSAYDNTDKRYTLADFSYHNDYVSIAAPGAEIWSACSSDLKNYVTALKKGKDDAGEVYYYQGTSKWYVKEADGIWYLRESGTSMATPFVTACYAMLMSDTSKSNAEDFGLDVWDAEDVDAYYLTVEQKALLAAAATYGDHWNYGYTEEFGYGTLNVACFATDSVESLTAIEYEIPPNTTYESATFPSGGDDNADWFKVCAVLLVGVILIWGINLFRAYSFRRKTNDDEPQQ